MNCIESAGAMSVFWMAVIVRPPLPRSAPLRRRYDPALRACRSRLPTGREPAAIACNERQHFTALVENATTVGIEYV